MEYSYHGGSGLVETMTDSTGTSEYEYDIQGRLTSYTPPQPSSREITYTYNNLGQKTSVTNGNFRVSYNYYANGWLKEVRLGFSPNDVSVVLYDYDSAGNRTVVMLDSGAGTLYAYDTDHRYRISYIQHSANSYPNVFDIRYTVRDNSGNPMSVEEEYSSIKTTTYTYDGVSRLATATYPGQSAVTFGYDWVGNRDNPPADPNGLMFNDADQLTRWPSSYEYEYFGNGDLQYQYDDGKIQLERTYSYTPTGLLSSVTYAGVQNPVTMAWDANSNRISFTDSTNQNTWYYVYDVTAGIPAVIEEVTPSGSVYYIREPGGELIARCTGTSGQNILYYHFDELGSTRMLTDANGNVTDMYEYDAWGNLTSHTGSTNQPYQYVGQLGYYTHYQEPTFDLLQLGVRFYDPQVGRFTQVDPAKDGLNWYLGMNANPVSRIDPWGLWSTADWLWWYFLDHGEELDLNVHAPDLMFGIRWLSPVQGMVREIKTIQDRRAKKKASHACKGRSSGNPVVRWPVDGSRGLNLTFYNYVIGKTSFYIKGNCAMKVNCCKRKYEYVCGVDLTLKDYFIDALDLLNLFPGHQDLADGTPYRFTGSWKENFYGRGGF